MSRYDNAVNKLFSRNTFHDLLIKGNNPQYESVLEQLNMNPNGKRNEVLISEIYSYLSNHYRNEYFYQNTLINKLLLGTHNVRTTTAIAQLPINESKADIVMINGRAVVYEIKTELDSYTRLASQVYDYYCAFDHVCIVTSEKQYTELVELLADSPAGIYSLTSRNTFSKSMRREPVPYSAMLDHEAMFRVLRKPEYEDILRTYFDCLPDSTPVFFYESCLNLFKQIPVYEAYQLMLKQLKRRNHIEDEEIRSVPYALRSLYYFSTRSKRNVSQLQDFLMMDYGG